MPLNWLGNQFQSFIDKEIEKRAHAAGRAMVAVAKSLVPQDTSYLFQHIYYTYLPSQRLLSLHADSYYSQFVEFGTFKMRPQPYLRPALQVAGPAFLTGVHTQIITGTSLPVNYTPRQILPHIRPHIAAANKRYNRGIVARMPAVAFHMNRQNQTVRNQHGFVVKSHIASLTRRRKAW